MMQQTFGGFSSLVQTPPKTLALFNHNNRTHVSTGVTEQQFKSLALLSKRYNPQVAGTQLKQVTDILDSVNVNHSQMTNQQKLRAAVMLGNNEIDGAWLQGHTQDITTNNRAGIKAGKILHEAYLFANAQQRGGLQGPADSLHTRLALNIADAVINGYGEVDVSLVTEMQKQLKEDALAGKLKAGPHHKAMIAMLDKFKTSSSMRDKLNSIQPPGKNTPQEAMLQATLGKTTSPLSRIDTRIAVMSAMLSDLRQGPVGSCFGTSIAIHLKKDHSEKMLDHMKDMVESGCIKGSFQKSSKDPIQTLKMPINLSLKDTQISQMMTVKSDGKVSHLGRRAMNEPQSLSEIPGLRSALASVGITDNVDKVLTDAIGRLRGYAWSVNVTPRELLDNIIDNTKSIGKDQKAAMKARAGDHFHSQVENRLLRSYEYTLSGMAEAHFVSPTLKSFANNLNTQLTTFQSLFEAKSSVTPDSASKLFYETALGFPEDLMKLVDRHIVLEYDATLPHSEPSKDGRSLFGGFAVTFVDPLTREPVRLTNTKQLRGAMEKLYNAVKDAYIVKFTKLQGTDGTKAQLGFKEYMSKMDAAIKDPGPNKKDTFMENLLPGIKNLQRVPLGFPRGAQPVDIMRMIFGGTSKAQVDTLPKGNRQPDDAGPVLKQMITTMRHIHNNISQVGKGYSQTDIEKMTVPVMNEPHAFLMDASLDSKFAQVIKSKENIDVWMKKTLFPQKLQTYGNTNLKPDDVRRVVSRLNSKLEINVETVMSQLKQKGSTKPKDVLDIVFNNVEKKQRTQVTKDQIGQFLAERLEAPVERVLVADTNWGDGEGHIYFGMVHNPFSQKTEMWNFIDDGQTIKPMGLPNQENHVQGTWTLPKEPKDFGF